MRPAPAIAGAVFAIALLGSAPLGAAEPAEADLALLEAVAVWPEQVGSGDAVVVRRLIASLGLAIGRQPSGDRVEEARYLRALLRMEPVSGQDLVGAREDLAAVARSGRAPWDARARHALAWIHEQDGRGARAFEGYQRVVIDHARDEAALRSAVGMGRLLLREGQPGRAAALLAGAIAAGLGPDVGADLTLEAAVRRLLAPGDPVAVARRSVALPAGDVSEIVLGALGLHVAERRAGTVSRLSAAGEVADRWSWATPVEALARDSRGRVFAAAGGSIWRLEPGGKTVEVVKLGEFDPPGAVAAGAGGLWVVDRRGQRLSRVEPGTAGPVLVWEDREAKIVALVWDGQRLLGLDARTGGVRALWVVGGDPAVVTATLPAGLRPESLSVDPAGRLLVVDTRSGALVLLGPDGAVLADLRAPALGLERIDAAALGLDGALHVVDGRGSTWVSWP